MNIVSPKFGDNLILNDTETRMIHMLVNGDDDSISRMTLTGVRCIDNCKLEVPEDIPLEDRIRKWSILEDWEGREQLPQDGDEIIIPSNW